MNIAVVDVAAENGGALSVLNDFLSYIINDDTAKMHTWFFYTSTPLNVHANHIKNVICNSVKKSWAERIKWELIDAKKMFESESIDVVFSLQNTGFFNIRIPQVVYFHNVLLLEDKNKYSLLKKNEFKYFIYTHLIAPYTIRSLNHAQVIITQTHTVREKLIRRVKCKDIRPIKPNIVVPKNIGKDDVYTKISGFIYPASPVPFKRIEEVIDCCIQNCNWFMGNEIEIIITISGKENTYSRKIRQLAEDHSFIRFVGYIDREKLLEKYNDYGLIVNSELESYPLPFIEASIMGAPIVAAAYTYAKEILNDNQTAYLYEPHDLKDMFRAISYAYNQSENRSYGNLYSNTWEDVKDIILQQN